MKQLIKKELMVAKMQLFMLLVFALLAPMVVYLDKISAYTMFIVNIIFFSYASISTCISEDKKTNTNALIYSLPIEKRDIVKSKYLIYGAIPIIFSISFYSIIIKYGSNRFLVENINLSFDAVLMSLVFTFLLLSFIIPILYRWYSRRIYINVLIYGLYLLSAIKAGNISMPIDLTISTWIILLIITIGIYLISLRISIRGLKKDI